jgi:hypothetical protein
VEKNDRHAVIKHIFSYLGFAIKSGAAVFGLDKIKNTKARIGLIILDASMSEKSKKEILFVAENKGVRTAIFEDIAEILPIKGVKVVAVTNGNLAERIWECYKELYPS